MLTANTQKKNSFYRIEEHRTNCRKKFNVKIENVVSDYHFNNSNKQIYQLEFLLFIQKIIKYEIDERKSGSSVTDIPFNFPFGLSKSINSIVYKM